jgi:HTH-type transcriptional regulator/antitoxin HigA
MASDPRSGWLPDWVVPPGEILLEALQDRGMTQSELARRMARPLKTINEIVKGKAAITAETAIQLERALGISARLWTGLETRFREYVARQAAEEELKAHARLGRWLSAQGSHPAQPDSPGHHESGNAGRTAVVLPD